MVQINQRVGKVAATVMGAFMLAGCGGDLYYGCPNHSGRTASSSRDIFTVHIEFTQGAGGTFDRERTYEYSREMFDPTAEKMKKAWVCDGVKPVGATLKEPKSFWWGL